jgi:flagellar basal-body rod protein FlgB
LRGITRLLEEAFRNLISEGYQPRDLAPFAKALAHADPAAALARTDPKHIAITGTLHSGQTLRPRERSPDGNGVSMEDQLTKVADTSSTQEMVANLYRKYQGMFRTAMGRAG